MASGNVPGATLFWERAPARCPTAPRKNAGHPPRDTAWAMSEENVGGNRARRRLGLTVRAFARLDHAWPGAKCTESVPPCRRLLAVKQAPEPRLVGRSDATTRRRPEMRASTKGKHEIGKRFAIVMKRSIRIAGGDAGRRCRTDRCRGCYGLDSSPLLYQGGEAKHLLLQGHRARASHHGDYRRHVR